LDYNPAMARRESEREDLLREATALVERAELRIEGHDEPIVVGFRRDGSASFFFGADPVYQFNTASELRRAYVDGLLYKAERGRLVALRRERSATEVALVRSELNDENTMALMSALRHRLTLLHSALLAGSYEIAGQVPTDSDVPARIARWLVALSNEISVASAPNVR
jgi:hypothetical protein